MLLFATACTAEPSEVRQDVVVAAPSTSVPAATMRVHYHRNDASYAGWGVYAFSGPVNPSTGWPGNRFLFDTADGDHWGLHVDFALNPGATDMGFLITLPNATNTDATKDCPQDQHVAISNAATTGQEIWVLSGDCTVYGSEPPISTIHVGTAAVTWLTPDTLVWPGADGAATYVLHTAANGGIANDASGNITGADASYGLTVDTAGLPAALAAKFPQYASATVLRAPGAVSGAAASLVQGEVVISQARGGAVVDGTQVQIAPVLDALYAAAAAPQQLGVTFDRRHVPTFRLWAPTARSVRIDVFADAHATSATSLPMARDAASGVWSLRGSRAWTNTAFYTFTVEVYSRSANNAVVTNVVTDPYSVSLNTNSARSMVLDLDDELSAPRGWPGRLIPTAAAPTDSAIYELHIRDFSANDASVPAAHQGKFLAFADVMTRGAQHLQALQRAGLTHIHLLNAYDIASVDEAGCVAAPVVPASTGADMAAATFVTSGNPAPQNTDCFNWGYDPFHYGAPEGSYSTAPDDGVTRVREFRAMVRGLHDLGLRVIMDVVYNHTSDAGQGAKSVLDKVVPGYYYRLNSAGSIENDSCCSDTAPEFAMMEKLMTDTLVRWTEQYKVDGFRFDLMSFIPKPALLRARDAVERVTAADGRRHTYFYGEGFNFGHVANGALFVQSSQLSLGGSGVGTFNDRIRDGVRGGGPFDSGASVVTNQGFISGLCYDNNDGSPCSDAQRATSFTLQDRISIGLAGNLATFPLNATTLGGQVDYFGQPTGYALTPQENISYISVHDNETIWDISQYKHPLATSPDDRARAQLVGLSVVALSEGVPLFHAADDLLRSKSDDGNSFNSGDYFNRIFWDGASNNWAVGAPPQNTGPNAANLTQEQRALGNPNAAVSRQIIERTSAVFRDFLAIRRTTSLFRLTTAEDVIRCVSFPDQRLGQVPGVIVMAIGGPRCGDGRFARAVVVFNASSTAQAFTDPQLVEADLELHPIQRAGADATVKAARFDGDTGTLHVPARTTAVFVAEHHR